MSDVAHTDLGVIDRVARALTTFEAAALAAQDQVARRVAAIRRRIADELSSRRRDLDAADVALHRCRQEPGADCSELARAMARAETRLAGAGRAMRLAEQESAALAPVMARLAREVTDATREGLAILGAARGNAEAYLGTAGAGGTSPVALPAGGPRDRPATGVTGVTGVPGISMVPLAEIDTGDRAIAPGDFRKGYSPADLTWAFNALHEVVLPALAQGRDADYFRARDASEGRMGTRSYADTFSGFLGADAIRLERRGEAFHVANGYHRIWVARQMGLDDVPARVEG